MCGYAVHHVGRVYSWYYGKTAGLLGTYDNEPANDMTTSDNSQAPSVESLADSWTVGRRCRPINRATITRHDADSPRYEACSQLFANESSPFRTCYRIVSPEPFLVQCLNDAESPVETDMCRVAASYVHECRRNEVHVRMPKHCGQFCTTSLHFNSDCVAYGYLGLVSCLLF